MHCENDHEESFEEKEMESIECLWCTQVAENIYFSAFIHPSIGFAGRCHTWNDTRGKGRGAMVESGKPGAAACCRGITVP